MSKLGFSTGKGFHDDVERNTEEISRVRNDVEFLCVKYLMTGLKIGESVELALPDGRTLNDIVGVEIEKATFPNEDVTYSYFGSGAVIDGVVYRRCVSFEVDMKSDPACSIFIDVITVLLAEKVDKITFTISERFTGNTDGTNGKRFTDGYFIPSEDSNTKRNVYLYFK